MFLFCNCEHLCVKIQPFHLIIFAEQTGMETCAATSHIEKLFAFGFLIFLNELMGLAGFRSIILINGCVNFVIILGLFQNIISPFYSCPLEIYLLLVLFTINFCNSSKNNLGKNPLNHLF